MSDFLVDILEAQNTLCHHGVLGQKWGVRRYQNPDGSLTEEGKRRYGFSKIDDSYAYANRPVTDAVKNRTAHDKQMISDIQEWEDKERKNILKGKQLVHQLKIMSFKTSRIFDDVDAKNGLPKQRNQETQDQTLQKVNPSKGTHLASGNNCCLCTVAYDLRRRGYDVIAKQNAPINLLYDIGPDDVRWAYNYKPKEVHTKSSSGLQKALEKEPNGSRGAAFCSWSGGSGGHVVAYEIKNGKPILMDAQTGTKYSKVSDLFDDVEDTSYMRLDNIDPNYNFVKIAVE